ncbi:sulfite exporter TauE/SafE family protein [Rhodopseudomonas sp. RCAM05734]|uniref:sulfite exporter TauE/SafE family protein n=1 Tax=Rhodopseudomonas sp. RCAM05734 TaxID=3457549 RepID=UPI0040441AF0
MTFDISIWIICGAVLLLAGFVKGVIGLGLPTISVGLLGLIMTPLQAAALLVIPNLVTNIWQLAIGEPVMALVRRLWPTLAGIVLGTLFGALALPAGTSRWAVIALGIILAVYALIGLSAVHLQVSPVAERWAGPLVGVLTGLVTVGTGVFVVPAVPYLQALGLSRAMLVQALGLSFLTSTIALAPAIAATGDMSPEIAGASLIALAPALGGMFLGQALRNKIGPAVFRRAFFGGLLLLGCYLATKPLL